MTRTTVGEGREGETKPAVGYPELDSVRAGNKKKEEEGEEKKRKRKESRK